MPAKLQSLTQSQINRFPEFIDRWTRIGLCTEPADRARAEEGVLLAYEIAGLKPPKKIVWCGSPFSQGLTRAIVFGLKESEVKPGASVWASVRASVRDSVWDSVGASVRASVGASVRDSVGASVFGQHDANWLGFYEYFKRACGLDEQTQKLAGLWLVAQNAGWWLPHEKICWISERHTVLHRNTSGRLHFDSGPALAYPDGWCIWALNGVRVPQWLAETRSEQLDPLKILAEQNAEVRREGVRKVGPDRLWHKCQAETLDRCGDYELGRIPIGAGRYGIALKMLNPSVPECWHVEFVPLECSTVQQALNFRNQLDAKQINDSSGADWYQQGDVILRPRGAKKFKSRPIVLT